jgi:hypothetical protein
MTKLEKKHLTHFGLEIAICTAIPVFSQPNLVVKTNWGARVTANYTKLSKSRTHFPNKCTNKVPGNQSASWRERKWIKKRHTFEKLQRPRCIFHPPINALSAPAPHINAKNQTWLRLFFKKQQEKQSARKKGGLAGIPRPGPTWHRRLEARPAHRNAGSRRRRRLSPEMPPRLAAALFLLVVCGTWPRFFFLPSLPSSS